MQEPRRVDALSAQSPVGRGEQETAAETVNQYGDGDAAELRAAAKAAMNCSPTASARKI